MPDLERLESIVAEVAARRDRGELVDPTTILAAHPDLAGPLRDALVALDLLDLSLAGDAAPSSLPERIGPYRVVSRIGAGGMGTVYLARTCAAVAGCEPEQRVALKVVHPHLLERPGFFKRFLREAESGRKVLHPHVVRTLDADAVRAGGDTVHFLVMEYVEGQTLADLLEDLGIVPESLLREIARQMAAGLSAIHDAGLIHRDLKPENALITPDHVVRLMDLGVARPVSGDDALTQHGAFAGSLPYASPEQFGDSEVTAAADLYSLGVTLYELATGKSPFRRDGFAAVMAAHREHVPPTVCEVVPETSPFFSDIVATLLAKQPDHRFPSAGDLAAVLTDCERSDWWRERESRRPRERVRPQVPVRRDTALHGRDADLAMLSDAWAAASAGDGRLVLLQGEAGIGKTRLVDAFLHEIGESDVHVLYGSYPPTGGLGGISDAILEHFGGHGLETALAPYLTVTPSLVPSLSALLRHQPPPAGAPSLTPEAIQTVLVHLMRALAAEKPLVWVVDDLHFADEESRAVVLSLGRAVEGERVLLLGTTRPGLPEDWLAHLGRIETFERRTLGRLSAREVILLLRDAFKSDHLAERLGGTIALKSDGVPFFVFEMIRGLREGQFITQMPDGTWAETRVVEHIEVPSAVRDLITARLRGLSDEHRAVLDAAAVHGFEFDPHVVARVLGRTRLAVLQDLASIERRSGVVRGGAGRCRFDHHQLQEVLYETLLPGLRCEYHVAIARALEDGARGARQGPGTPDGSRCVELCEHYLKGERGEEALQYLEPALDQLSRSYQHAHLVALTGRALAEPHVLTGTARANALLRLCEANGPLDMLACRDLQEEYAREAWAIAESTEDEELLRPAAAALGNACWTSGRYDEAELHHRRALDLARTSGHRAAEAAALGDLGAIFWKQSRLDEAKDHHTQAVEVYREIGDRMGEARATGNLGAALYSEGRYVDAKEQFERDLEISREIEDRIGENRASLNLFNASWSQGRADEARPHFERSVVLSRETGYRLGEAHAMAQAAMLAFSADRLAEAKELCERCIALLRALGDADGEAWMLGNLGVALLGLGRLADARAEHERQLALSRELGNRRFEAKSQLDLAAVLREEGDATGTERCLAASLAISDEVGDRNTWARAQLAQGSLRAARDLAGGGDGAAGREPLVLARDRAPGGGAPSVETHARCALARLPGGSVEDALAAYSQNEARLWDSQRREALLLLWIATGDRAHLDEAKHLLDDLLEKNPPEYHESMCRNVRVNREILRAWREEFGDDEPGGTESVTRVG